MPHSSTVNDEVLPPEEYICPLTKQVMDDPVVSRYGIHFERSAIIEWLGDGHFDCPVTGNPLRLQNLVSDKTLKWKIKYWKDKHSGHDQGGEEAKSSNFLDDSTRSNDSNYIGPGERMLGLNNGGASGPGLGLGLGLGLCAAIPDSKFICPLTKEVMKNPMMSKTGYNYESDAILKYLQEVDCKCPISGQPLYPSDLVSNKKLKWDIDQWLKKYGCYATISNNEMTKLEYETKLNKAVMVSQDYHISDILKALTEIEVAEDNDTKKKAAAASGTTTDTIPEEKEKDVLDVLDDVVDTLEG